MEDEQGEIIELINPRSSRPRASRRASRLPERAGQVRHRHAPDGRARARAGPLRQEFEVEDEELTARCFCHEIEHLDGHLYTEHCKVLTDEELEQYIREQEKELDEE